MRKIINRSVASWCLYDFANSTYSAVIAAVVFPVYYTTYIVGNDSGLGDLWWGRAISLSMLIVALLTPLLGGFSDYAGLRKRFLFFFTYLSIISVALLGFIKQGMVMEGFCLVVLANIGMEGAMVFYNAFLPDISDRSHRGRVSSWGFGVGYLGSIVSLLVAMVLVKKNLYAYTWLSVSCLFALCSLPAFLFLPKDKKQYRLLESAGKGLKHTFDTLKNLFADTEARKFLIAYLFYSDGVNTVIVFSSVFAATTLGFTTPELVMLYMLVQVTALCGAFVMARPTDYLGPRKVIIFALCMWTAVSVLAYFTATKGQFWAVAAIAGFSLGSVQAASRAFYSMFIPKERESEYFGVYAFVGKSSAVLGPFLFGVISTGFGGQRPAVLSIAVFFLIGLVLLKMSKCGGPSVIK